MRDEESLHDVTSYTLVVKRPDKTAYRVTGQFTNHFLDKAFGENISDQNIAIETVKEYLWRSFRKLYNGETE